MEGRRQEAPEDGTCWDLRHAGSLHDKAGSLPVRAPPQGLIVVQRLVYTIFDFSVFPAGNQCHIVKESIRINVVQ